MVCTTLFEMIDFVFLEETTLNLNTLTLYWFFGYEHQCSRKITYKIHMGNNKNKEM